MRLKRFIIVLAVITMGLAIVYPVHAQEDNPPPTPNPTVEALEEQVDTQESDIEDLSRQVEDLQRDLELAKREVNTLFTVRMAIAAGIAVIATFLGISSYQGIKRTIEAKMDDTVQKAHQIQDDTIDRATQQSQHILDDLEEIRERTRNLDERISRKIDATISQQLYMLDPSVIPIYVERGRNEKDHEDMERVYNRLILSGFKHVEWFTTPSKLNQHGITILRVTNTEACSM